MVNIRNPLNKNEQEYTIVRIPIPSFWNGGRGGGGLTLPKIQRKGAMGKFLKGRGDPKKGEFCWKVGYAVSLDIFSSWGVANVLIFSNILVIVFLFPLNVGVSHIISVSYIVLSRQGSYSKTWWKVLKQYLNEPEEFHRLEKK